MAAAQPVYGECSCGNSWQVCGGGAVRGGQGQKEDEEQEVEGVAGHFCVKVLLLMAVN